MPTRRTLIKASLSVFSTHFWDFDATKPKKFLFIGDSITDGNRGRNQDPNHIMGHGFAFSLASRIGANFPKIGLSFVNKGISGNKVTDLKNRWKVDCIDQKPDVLNILVGINDFNSFQNAKDDAVNPMKYESVYRELLNETKNTFPEIILVICSPFLVPVGKYKDNFEKIFPFFKEYHKISKRLATEFNAIFIDLQEVFDKEKANPSYEYWIWDGIHPTVVGHELIVKAWLEAMKKRIKILREIPA